MKKIILILIILLNMGNLFAERTYFSFYDIFEGKEIIKRTKKIIDVPVSDFSLAYLNNDDCRLLRNLIFFYHGYEFKSEDLNYYFNNFYERETPVKETALSEIDTKNVNLIQSYEKRKLQSEIELKKIPLNPELMGSWYLESFIVGNSSCAELEIKKDGTFSFSPNLNNFSRHIVCYNGNVYCNSNTLFLYIKSIALSEEESRNYFDPLYDYDSKVKTYTLTPNEPIILSFPISMPERSEAEMLIEWDEVNRNHDKPLVVNNYIHMELGSLVFFKDEMKK